MCCPRDRPRAARSRRSCASLVPVRGRTTILPPRSAAAGPVGQARQRNARTAAMPRAMRGAPCGGSVRSQPSRRAPTLIAVWPTPTAGVASGRTRRKEPSMAVAHETFQHLTTAGLAEVDPQIAELLTQELERQRGQIELIASENFTWP